MIKVGLDISQLAHFGGVATYTQNLATELIKFPDLEMVYFYSSLRRPYQGQLKNVKKFKLPPTFFEMMFNKLHNVPIERFLGQLDVYHSSDWTQPPSRAKKVTTYHDVVALKYPQWSNPKIEAVNKRRLALVEKEVDMVIAVSESTKKDLLSVSKIPAEKIVVIYEGVEEKFKVQSRAKIAEFKRNYKLPEKFVLAIGGIGERRNLHTAKKASEDFKLIITRENINIPSSEMPLLYGSAEVLLYPSFYEGFGLPILEAMACGTPVITSNVSAMPEVAGKAALLVDPNNLSAIKEALNSVMNDQKLKKKLQQDGLKRAQEFSWVKTTQQTAQVYKDLMKD